jgi:hypothetical protein
MESQDSLRAQTVEQASVGNIMTAAAPLHAGWQSATLITLGNLVASVLGMIRILSSISSSMGAPAATVRAHIAGERSHHRDR